MALFDSVQVIDNLNVNEVFAGTTSNIYTVPGNCRPTTNAKIPAFGLALQGSNPTAREQAAFFSGGGVAAPGQCAIRVAGTVFAAGCIIEIKVKSTVGGVISSLALQYTVQAGATAASIATAVVAAFNAARAGGAITNGRIICSNRAATTAQISAALTADYVDAVVTSSTTITLETADDGAAANYYDATCQIYNSAPSPLITLTDDGVPNLPGVHHWGATRDFNYQGNPQVLDIPADNTFNLFAKILTGEAPTITFNAVQGLNFQNLTYASGSATPTFTNSESVLLFGGRQNLTTLGLIFVTPSKLEPGQYNMFVIYEAPPTTGLALNQAKSGDNPIAVSMSPVPSNSAGNPFGHLQQFRQIA
jgi:hypothetical protein